MYRHSELYPPVDGQPMPVSLRELRDANVEVRGNWVTLRPHRISDSAAVVGLIALDPEHLRQFGDTTGDKYKKPSDFARSIAQAENPFRLRFGIWDGSLLVGSINLEPIDDNRAVVGYWVGKEHEGQGYTTDALTTLVRFAFEELGCNELEAEADQDNVASRRVLEKVGFNETGEIRGRSHTAEIGKETQRIQLVYALSAQLPQ